MFGMTSRRVNDIFLFFEYTILIRLSERAEIQKHTTILPSITSSLVSFLKRMRQMLIKPKTITLLWGEGIVFPPLENLGQQEDIPR